MATTTNFGWSTPDDTALVSQGAAAIRTLGSSIDTTTKALNPSTTLGDIEYRSSTANTNTRLAIGSSGQVLTVSGGVPAWTNPTASTANYVGVSVYNSSAITLTDNVENVLTFDSENFDSDAFHSTSSNTDRLTVPAGKGGKYLITGAFQLTTAGATGRFSIRIAKNGTVIWRTEVFDKGTTFPSPQTSVVVNATAGDYFTLIGYPISMGVNPVAGGAVETMAFSMSLLGA